MSIVQLALIPVLVLLLVVWFVARRWERVQEQAWERGEGAPVGSILRWDPLRWLANRRAQKDVAQPKPAKQSKAKARQQAATPTAQASSPAPIAAAQPPQPASQTPAPASPASLELQERYLALTQRIEAMEQEARRKAASPPPVAEAPRSKPVEERGPALGQFSEENIASLRTQAQATLDHAATIREETLHIRNETRQSLDKALNIIAAAHQAGSAALEELEQARAQARDILESARRQALQEADDIRQRAHTESQRLLSEATKARSLVERELEEAHSLAAEARASRDAARRELDQARAMKQEVEALRFEVLRLLEQQPEAATAPPPVPRAATPPPPPPPTPSMEEKPVESSKAEQKPPVLPQAQERREPAQAAPTASQPRSPEPVPGRSDIEQALAELLRGAGSAYEPEPPTPKRPAKDNPPPPARASTQGTERPRSGAPETLAFGIGGRAVAAPPQAQPAPAATQQPVAARPAPKAEPTPLPSTLTGTVVIVATPTPGQDTLGRLWTAIESITGIGSIVSTRPSMEPAGLELAVDLGGQTVETAKLSSALYGADIEGAGTSRIVVRLPVTW